MSLRAKRLFDPANGFFGSKAAALGTYALLVVLPTLVLGVLHWHQLYTEHQRRVAEFPERSQTLALRMESGVQERIDAFLRVEEDRPWYHYRREYYDEPLKGNEVPILPSELVSKPRPEGLEAWFSYDLKEGPTAQIEFFGGSGAEGPEWETQKAEMERLLRRLIREDDALPLQQEAERRHGHRESKLWASIIGVNLSTERDPDCLRASLSEIGPLRGREIIVNQWSFHLRLVRDERGDVRLLAMRWVQIPLQLSREETVRLPDCFLHSEFSADLVQGFFIDPDWLFRRVPRVVADLLLDASGQLLLANDPLPVDLERESLSGFNIVSSYGIEFEHPEDETLGQANLRLDFSALQSAFHSTMLRFWCVAGMMVVSLSTGMWLLVRSVQSSMAEARRTENFVAAVSHELRTPLAAVKMYGEMLQDGWASDRAKQADYLERILRETNRLDALVDRVLEKRRLAAKPPEAIVGDLAELVQEQVPDLLLTAGAFGKDVAFSIEPGLPPVRLIPEAVRGILANLVENARKYAPVDPQQPGAEPILVQVRKLGRQVVLEVHDRGPGIPEGERTKIFQAFYRIGDERTRRTSGTGLGLHLVWLQAKAMGARVAALGREGGGSTFRVSFRTQRTAQRAEV